MKAGEINVGEMTVTLDDLADKTAVAAGSTAEPDPVPDIEALVREANQHAAWKAARLKAD